MNTATAVGYVEMRIAKAVGLARAEDEPSYHILLEELSGDRQLAIAIGHAEAFSLAARLGGIEWRRPMTYQFAAGLVQALGGQVRQVRIERVVEESYHRHRGGGRPGWREAGRRTAQRRAEPRHAGPGPDLRRPRGAAGGRGQSRG
jgi:hypothetical protein